MDDLKNNFRFKLGLSAISIILLPMENGSFKMYHVQ